MHKRSQNPASITQPDKIEVDSYLSAISTGAVMEADDSRNSLGRRQTMIADVSTIRTTEGRILVGTRVLKILGEMGDPAEQAAVPFLREGAIYSARIGRPILGSLAVRRSPDWAAGYYAPEFFYTAEPQIATKHRTAAITPDEAFAAIQAFDETFFPPETDQTVIGLTHAETLALRQAEQTALGVIQGFRLGRPL